MGFAAAAGFFALGAVSFATAAFFGFAAGFAFAFCSHVRPNPRSQLADELLTDAPPKSEPASEASKTESSIKESMM